MAPHFLLRELGVEFELIYVDRKSNAQRSPEYLKLNPNGKIPTLVYDSQAIFESAAICLFLAEKHGDANLIPSINSPDRAKFYQWLSYLSGTVQPALMMYFYPERHCGDSAISKQIAASAEDQVIEMLALIDKHMQGRAYLVGDDFTACDCYLFMLLVWADELRKPPLEFSSLSPYLTRIAKRGAIQKVCDFEGLSLEAYGICPEDRIDMKL